MQTYLKAIESELSTTINTKILQKTIADSMNYSLLAGGKRIRPVLTLEFCRMTCGTWEQALPLACALEMIHTYSLIHDDLPCMDNDDFRRGRPTNHKVYGEAMAVLAGDGLLTAAFTKATTAKLPAETVVACIQELSLCAGELGMVGGQVLDIEGENRKLEGDYIHEIQRLKTGKLLEAACVMGTIAGGGTPEQVEAARTYAKCLGLAFQTQDDILDVTGDEKKLGKPIGTDTQKNTFVRLYGLEKCREIVQKETAKGVEALHLFSDNQFLTDLAWGLTRRES
ncbi:MAG: farnesyl diphosphate synthase [Eubacteriales bacterium]